MRKHFYPRDVSKASKGQRQARIHTGFHRFTEMGQIFYNKYIFHNKITISKLKSGQYPRNEDFKELKSKNFLGEPVPGSP